MLDTKVSMKYPDAVSGVLIHITFAPSPRHAPAGDAELWLVPIMDVVRTRGRGGGGGAASLISLEPHPGLPPHQGGGGGGGW